MAVCAKCFGYHDGPTKCCRPCLDKRMAHYAANRERETAAFRADYEFSKAAGVCVQCRAEEVEGETTRCRRCNALATATRTARRAEFKRKGLCRECGRRRGCRTLLCKPCREVVRATRRAACKCGLDRHPLEKACALCLTISASTRQAPLVVKSLIGHPWATVYELAASSGTTTRTVLRVLSRLRRLGGVDRAVGEDDRAARWKILLAGEVAA